MGGSCNGRDRVVGIDYDNINILFIGGVKMVNVDKGFLNRMIMIRKSAGLSQTDLAKKIGCTRANISAFENGLSNSGRLMLEYLKLGKCGLNDLTEVFNNG